MELFGLRFVDRLFNPGNPWRRGRTGYPPRRRRRGSRARVRALLWLVTFAALLAAGLAVGASSAASVLERRTEIGLMKALGAGSGIVGFLLAAEQLLLA